MTYTNESPRFNIIAVNQGRDMKCADIDHEVTVEAVLGRSRQRGHSPASKCWLRPTFFET